MTTDELERDHESDLRSIRSVAALCVFVAFVTGLAIGVWL